LRSGVNLSKNYNDFLLLTNLLTLARKAACLIIGKNFEKSYSVQVHTQKQLPLLYALAIAAQIAFARRYVRMAFEKFPNY